MLERMETFNCLVRILSSECSYCLVVSGNLCKVRCKLGRFYHILVQEGSYPWTSGRLYVSVVQCVLILGLETWVVNP